MCSYLLTLSYNIGRVRATDSYNNDVLVRHALVLLFRLSSIFIKALMSSGVRTKMVVTSSVSEHHQSCAKVSMGKLFWKLVISGS